MVTGRGERREGVIFVKRLRSLVKDEVGEVSKSFRHSSRPTSPSHSCFSFAAPHSSSHFTFCCFCCFRIVPSLILKMEKKLEYLCARQASGNDRQYCPLSDDSLRSKCSWPDDKVEMNLTIRATLRFLMSPKVLLISLPPFSLLPAL